MAEIKVEECESEKSSILTIRDFAKCVDGTPSLHYQYEMVWCSASTPSELFFRDTKKFLGSLTEELEEQKFIGSSGSIVIHEIYTGPYKSSKRSFLIDLDVFKCFFSKKNFLKIRETGDNLMREYFLFNKLNKNKIKHEVKKLSLETNSPNIKFNIELNSWDLELRNFKQIKPCLLVKFSYGFNKLKEMENSTKWDSARKFYSVRIPFDGLVNFYENYLNKSLINIADFNISKEKIEENDE